MRHRLPCLLVVMTLMSSVAGAQSVWVVDDDGGPGVDFTSVDAAIQAATDGDFILVKDGTYLLGSAVIDGVGLTIFAEDGATVIGQTLATLIVRNLAATQTVTFRGFPNMKILSRMEILLEDNRGTVWFDSCQFLGDSCTYTPAIQANDCDSVVLTSCDIFGPVKLDFPSCPHAPALIAERSNLSLYDSSLEGDNGFSTVFGVDGPGADAAIVTDGVVMVSGSQLAGGDGVGPNGDGLRADGTAAVYTLDSTFAAFAPGQGLRVGPDSTHTPFAGDSRAVAITSPRRMGQPMTVTITGNPLDLVWLPHNLNPGYQLMIPSNGVFLLSFQQLLNFRLGFIPPSGVLTLNLSAPTVPGLAAVSFFSQPMVLDLSNGEVYLGAPSQAVLLDPVY